MTCPIGSVLAFTEPRQGSKTNKGGSIKCYAHLPKMRTNPVAESPMGLQAFAQQLSTVRQCLGPHDAHLTLPLTTEAAC